MKKSKAYFQYAQNETVKVDIDFPDVFPDGDGDGVEGTGFKSS